MTAEVRHGLVGTRACVWGRAVCGESMGVKYMAVVRGAVAEAVVQTSGLR